MRIYFAASIRGGRDDLDLRLQILDLLADYGTVLTEHVAEGGLLEKENGRPVSDIYEEDVAWLKSADAVVAEVTTPSLGVGYEIGMAESLGKPVLCIHHLEDPASLSAMVSGNGNLEVRRYAEPEELRAAFREFFEKLK